MEVRAKFWIENKGEVVLGAGKTALILAVDRLGSIQRAAEELGMSYRHAWGALKKIEQRAGFKILDRKLGGRDGGAQLTPEGKALVKTMDSLFKDLQTIVGVELALVVKDIRLKRQNLFVLIITAGTAIWNMGVAYLAGLVLYYGLQRRWIRV